MSEEKYSNDMRGSLWVLTPDERKNEKSPVASGTIEIAGVRLRIAMWAKRVVAKPGSKANGKTYMPIKVEYEQGATRFLCPVNPSAVTVTSAGASAQQTVPDGGDAAGTVDDMPF